MKGKTKLIRALSTLGVALLGAMSLSGCGFKDDSKPYKVNLEVWSVFDDSDTYTQLFAEYRKMNPYVGDITYRKLSIDTYKKDLLDAMAAGKGPDLFLARSSWLPEFQDKIVAAPDALIGERAFREAFVDVVGDDFVGQDGKIYGAPLSVDSLALYYNKDLFNAAGITAPPATWEEFVQDAQLLSRVDSFGNIVQSGAALGTSSNINRSTDILSALMLQKGVPFWDREKRDVDFGGEKGVAVLDFYTRFANGTSPFYSWNSRMHNSIDAFYEGNTAMMVNYSWHYETLRRKNAKLNFGVAPLPRFSDGLPVNYANYWGYAVSRNKAPDPSVKDVALHNRLRVHEAWQLLGYLALPHNQEMDANGSKVKKLTLQNGMTGNVRDFPLTFDPARVYAEKTRKPSARRDLVEAQKKDTVLGPFAEGNLNAKSWFQVDPEAIEGVLSDTINRVNLGQDNPRDALDLARTRISRIMRR
jgi:ABC-type glycerol-3-phosphate transport system substrate-binding protein